jgi:hypothetical protein
MAAFQWDLPWAVLPAGQPGGPISRPSAASSPDRDSLPLRARALDPRVHDFRGRGDRLRATAGLHQVIQRVMHSWREQRAALWAQFKAA